MDILKKFANPDTILKTRSIVLSSGESKDLYFCVVDTENLDDIIVDFYNSREIIPDSDEINALADDIVENKQITPALARIVRGKLSLIDGSRRLHVAKKYKLPLSVEVFDGDICANDVIKLIAQSDTRCSFNLYEQGVMIAHKRAITKGKLKLRDLQNYFSLSRQRITTAELFIAMPDIYLELLPSKSLGENVVRKFIRYVKKIQKENIVDDVLAAVRADVATIDESDATKKSHMVIKLLKKHLESFTSKKVQQFDFEINGVTGRVRNCADGTKTVEIKGVDENNVNQMLSVITGHLQNIG